MCAQVNKKKFTANANTPIPLSLFCMLVDIPTLFTKARFYFKAPFDTATSRVRLEFESGIYNVRFLRKYSDPAHVHMNVYTHIHKLHEHSTRMSKM